MPVITPRRTAGAVVGLAVAGAVLLGSAAPAAGPPLGQPARAASWVLPETSAPAPAPVPPTTVPAPVIPVPRVPGEPAPTPAALLRRDQPVPALEDLHAREPWATLGTIEVPRFGLAATLNEGMAKSSIDHGPAHWPGTALPGEAGNVVVAGHRVTKTAPFRAIAELRLDDEIVFTVEGRRSVYRVTQAGVVDPSELWIVDETPENVVTLFACHPPGSARYRFVVRAELEGPPFVPPAA